MAVCALTVLDGVGDEATALGGVVLLVVAIILAWLSTHVADRGDHILGTILTVGAHASLIGLGGHDGYVGAPSSTDVEDQPDANSNPEEKPEEEESRAEEGEEDELLDIQRVRRKKRKIQKENKGSRQHAEGGEDEEEYEEDDDDDDDDEEEEEVDDELENITVRLKYLNDTEEVAVLRPHDTVGLLKSKYFSGRERQIKLIWQGQLLQDPRRTLASLNITHNSVLHCHVSQAPAQPEAPGGPEESARARGESGASGGLRSVGLTLSSSSLVVPVFVVMLAVVWYFRIHYRQLFTAPATVSLVGVTVFFSFFIFGMHSR
ncbi:transmembrane and ubiquitin-like domain-containing protein 2 [Sardina pilchardus]|uniref:transmembrane and ubiquitin-like domain-containing protein 2 n=1 Tax=Sardina pilchardus TaxID=27697 RepID=UPI002E15FB3E